MSREQFAEAYLAELIDMGVSMPEMRKIAAMSADVLERLADRGEPVDGMLDAVKQANFPAIYGAIGSQLSGIAGKGVDIGAAMAGGLSTPVALAALLGPTAMGYGLGSTVGKMSDPGKDVKDELDRRELIAELRNQTARLRANQREEV